MNRLLFAAAAIVVLCALPAQADDVTTTVDPNCKPVAAWFVVPAGSVAMNFTSSSVNGKDCEFHNSWKPTQFVIATELGYTAYAYYNREGRIWEVVNFSQPMVPLGSEPQALKTVVLQPGKYALSADGGAGATVKLTYALVTK